MMLILGGCANGSRLRVMLIVLGALGSYVDIYVHCEVSFCLSVRPRASCLALVGCGGAVGRGRHVLMAFFGILLSLPSRR